MEPTATPIPATPVEPCDRCGAFAPLFDGEGGRYCEPCVARLRHPIQRDPLTVGGILGGVWKLLRAVGFRVAVVAVIFAIPVIASEVAWPNHLRLLALAGAAVGVLGMAAVLGLARAAVTGRRPSVAVAVADGVRRYWPVLLVEVVIGLGRNLGLWLLVFPGLYVFFSFWLAGPIALHEDLRGAHALAASYDRMKGRRLVAGGAYLVAMLPATVVWGVINVPRLVWLARHRHHPLAFDGDPLHIGLYLAHHLTSVLLTLVLAVVYEKTRPEVRPPWVPPAGSGDDEITELTPEELEALTGPLPTGD